MKILNLPVRRTGQKYAFGILLLAICFGSCKKADKFYEKLQALPQIISSGDYAYNSAYVVDDTLTIYGHLMPEKEFSITIGGINAEITETASILAVGSSYGTVDKVSVIITEAMIGNDREVKITSGGYSTLGANINVYDKFGEGSLETELEASLLHSLSGKSPTFLHCLNGKGDVYYYSATNKNMVHVAKDGAETMLYNLSGVLTAQSETLTEFIAGGVDPQGKNLYFSANVGTAYVFCKIDLATSQLSLLNRSTGTSYPYEGTVGAVNMLVSGIYPDSDGTVYLGVGLNQSETPAHVPDGIAVYSAASGNIKYVYNRVFSSSATTMPGKNIGKSGSVQFVRFSPDEKTMYLLQRSNLDFSIIIDVFDIDAGVMMHTFTTTNTTGNASLYAVIGAFADIRTNLTGGAHPGTDFGYLPMPGKRLQALLFTSPYWGVTTATLTNLGLPEWITFSFAEERTYAYAVGRFRISTQYEFRTTDELLNYDEDGHLYASSNGRAYLLKTKTR